MSNKIPCGGFYLDDMLNVNDNGELSINGGTPYQQLVTDGSGNVKWEDRLGYETEPVSTEIVPEQNVLFESAGDDSGLMAAVWSSTFNAVRGSTYIVKFDDVEYKCPCISFYEGGPLILGNLSIINPELDDTKEPFVMLYNLDNKVWQIASKDSASTHTISIHSWQTEISKIDEKFLPVASDNNYGVVKKSEIVTSYVFDQRVPHDEMVEAVTAFYNGRASISWDKEAVIYASYNSSADTVIIKFAKRPYTTYTFENQGNIYVKTISKSAYDEISCNRLRLYNKDIYSLISMDGTSLQNRTVSFSAEHLSLNSLEILNEKELILFSSTVDSRKRFKITVDDSGTISATEVT